MEIRSFLTLDLAFIVVVYFAFLLFIHPARSVTLPSLLGGLVMGLINMLVDIVAHFTNVWHYTISGLTFYVPLPFYITPILFYGSVVYLLIWRFWSGRGHWFALVLLVGIPIFGILRDLWGGLLVRSPYNPTWSSPLSLILDIAMWVVMFYTGFFIFNRLAPTRNEVQAQEGQSVGV
ncbi:MAG: hypothetical protein NVS4B11_31390 [Ktedonobacteraceae bacterium]